MESGLDILVADSSPIRRFGTKSYLTPLGHRIVYEASNWEQTLLGSNETKPDVIIIDYLLPNLQTGFLDKSILKLANERNILFYDYQENIDRAMQVIKNGAKGYLSKCEPLEFLSEAVLNVSRGKAYFSPEISRQILNRSLMPNQNVDDLIFRLTNREREVLVQIAEGYSNKEIAGMFNIGTRTVETHRERIMRKLDIHSIAGLTKFAIRTGYVKLDLPDSRITE